jgi:DNA-binding NtrC family response regulator
MECIFCRKKNRDSALYFKGCGKQIEMKCSHCQNFIPSDSKFCDGCGTSISPLGDVTSGLEDKEKTMVEWIRDVLNKGRAENLFESCTEKFSSILIKEALKMTGGNRSQAARLLGLSRPTLHSKLEKLLIE